MNNTFFTEYVFGRRTGLSKEFGSSSEGSVSIDTSTPWFYNK